MRLKKSLGRNFLHDKSVLADIVASGEVKVGDTILEVGPGEGVLTRALLDTGATVVAIEKDDRLIPVLTSRFQKEITSDQLTLVRGDALEFSIFNFQFSLKPKFSNYKIIANIPYYLTGALLKKIFSEEHLPTLVVLMVQKEVAERVCASDSRESILSLSIKAYGTPEIVREVSRNSFDPTPDVDSAVLKISNISRKYFDANNIGEKTFFSIIRSAFASKRKTLENNLKSRFDKEIVRRVLEQCDIKSNTRAEELSLAQWAKIITLLK